VIERLGVNHNAEQQAWGELDRKTFIKKAKEEEKAEMNGRGNGREAMKENEVRGAKRIRKKETSNQGAEEERRKKRDMYNAGGLTVDSGQPCAWTLTIIIIIMGRIIIIEIK
jgi:hypothetical protein